MQPTRRAGRRGVDDLQACLERSLSDRYHLDRELGRGGMAVVHLAEDLKHHRKIALEMLDPESSVLTGAERFLAEAKHDGEPPVSRLLPFSQAEKANAQPVHVMPCVEGDVPHAV